jgi:dihydroxy-acid dehydratase
VIVGPQQEEDDGRPATTRRYRSGEWFDGDDEVAILNRVALRIPNGDQGKPVIGIADTTSDLNPCNAAFPALLPHIERGVRDAGGVPARFPAMSLGEDLMKPSAMLYRNLLSIELEEHARAYPLDGMVLLANCDKTVPAALMAAASAGLPSLLLLGGARSAPLLRGHRLGSGTDLWRLLEERRAGQVGADQWAEVERVLSCAGPGSCNTMGTASTMALMTEALGMCLPGITGCRAGGNELADHAYRTGVEIVRLVTAGSTPQDQMTQQALDNAYRIIAAVGGSTNAVIHLAAVAGRLGLDCGLSRIDRIWADIPLLVDVEPCGSGLIHDFHAAGGYPTLARVMIDAGLLDPAVTTATGIPLVKLARTAPEPSGVIRPASDPVLPGPTLAAVFGTLAPDGAVIKVAAASPELLQHRGRAVVFQDYEEMRQRLDDDRLEIRADDVIVVRGCGPVGVPGMPEWGMAPIPRRLAEAGVRDILRISDGRMSGTSFGTVVLHVAPEAAAGGPLGLVEDGDLIALDLDQRRLDLYVERAELERRVLGKPAQTNHLRGWPRHYQEHVLQAPDGCDMDYLTGPTPEARRFIEPVVGRS